MDAMRLLIVLVLAAVAPLLAGCTTIPKRPELLSAEIIPNALKPGDSAVVRVAFQDRFSIIDHVHGQIPEDPSIVFRLRDNGIDPDEMANDDVWTLLVDVPFNAPAGEFSLELTAYNSDDRPILVQNSYREVEPLKTSVTLTIEPND